MNKLLDSNEPLFISNGKLVNTEFFDEKLLTGNVIIYEVIRIINSSPIFLTEHLQRLIQSIQLAGLPPINQDSLYHSINLLLDSNPVKEKNIKVVVHYKSTAEEPQFLIFFIPSKYPTLPEKTQGIAVKTIHATRINPEVKAENVTLRSYADEIISACHCYEVLLINDLGLITEGSRSNVFFLRNGKLITAPLSLVLGGVTRLKVIDICHDFGINVSQECISEKQLHELEGGFISGTSPGILPINRINNIELNVNIDLIKQLTAEYEKIVQNEIKKWK